MQRTQKRSYKKMKYIYLIISVMIGLYNNATVSAAINTTYELGTGDTVYTYEELLTKYKTAGTSYDHNTISYQIEFYNSDLAVENYSTMETQYEELFNKRAELQAMQELYLEYKEVTEDEAVLAQIDSQLKTIGTQLEQYDINISSAKVSVAEAKLQKAISQFYTNNKTLVLQEAQNKLTNEFLKKTYNLILLKEQKDYYATYQEYLQIVEKVENIKYKRGLADSYSLDLSEANLSKNLLEINKSNTAYQELLSAIKSETKTEDNSKIILPVLIEQKEYKLDQTISKFESNNSSLLQYKYLKECYQDYLYENNGNYTKYKQVELRIKDYQIQYDELKMNIKTYVTDAISAYNSAFDNMEQTEKELLLANNRLSIVLAKKDHKKATELDVSKAKYEVEAAQVSYYQAIYDIIIKQNILDSNIYGVTP